ncbi:MAG: transcription termination factor Rho [Rubritalea sp.]|uniref:transcription termination factor Rho n=1 Tax=Rubritalea sp. TaxID=2109375 RepID=UPI003242FB2A
MSEEASKPEDETNVKTAVAKKTVKKAAKKATKKVTAKKASKKTAKKAAKKTTAKKATKKSAKKAAKKTTAKKAAQKTARVAPPAAAPTPTPLTTAAQPVVIEQPAPRPSHSDEAPRQSAPPSESDNQTQDDNRHRQNNRKARNGRVEGGGPVHQNNRNTNNDRNNNNRNRNNRNNRDNSNDRNSNRGKGKNNRRNNNNVRRGPKEHRETKPVVLTGPPVAVSGILELSPKGFGFLRELSGDLEQSSNDVFISPDIVRVNGLRVGVWIDGIAQQGPRGLQVTELEKINGMPAEKARKLPHFDELKAVNPNKRIPFETTAERFTTRVLDIMAPVGRGQRGLIVSPPRSGKTTMMMHMAEAIQEKYNEEMHLMILLVDERPEEVTEFKMSLPGAEIYASSNDSGAKNHCRVAELCIERAKRLVEAGEHVFLMMDSITRLARSYNTVMGGSKKGKGRGIQSGGIVSGALEMPRRLFAAARNTRSAGSLTIVATALVHTNSRADDAIFQEFKGTGNMELVLDRRIAEQYIYPAVDIFKSGTRREELLLPEHMLHKIHLIRRGLSGARPHEAMERLLFFLKRFHNNAQMLLEIKG